MDEITELEILRRALFWACEELRAAVYLQMVEAQRMHALS